MRCEFGYYFTWSSRYPWAVLSKVAYAMRYNVEVRLRVRSASNRDPVGPAGRWRAGVCNAACFPDYEERKCQGQPQLSLGRAGGGRHPLSQPPRVAPGVSTVRERYFL
jgi:hypothetical protein